MKYFLVFLILISYQTQAQQENALFLTLDEVEDPPAFPGCEGEDFKSCSSERIATFLMQNIDPELLFNLEEAENYVNLRFIVDTAGKVRRPMTNAHDIKLRNAANESLATMPNFNPGTHNGKPVNTIIDVPVKLFRGSLSQAEKDFLTTGEEITSSPSNDKILPIASTCKESADPKRCTSLFVQDFFNKNFNSYNIRTNNELVGVKVHFAVDETGKITDLIAEGNHEKLKKEALKALKKLPDFIPATQEGKKVPSTYTFSVKIQSSR